MKMKMKNRLLVVVMAIVALLFAFSGCAKKEEPQNQENGITLKAIYDGETVDLLPQKVRDYLEEEDFDAQCEFLLDNEGKNYDFPNLSFEWKSANSKHFTVHFAENAEFQDEITFETTSKSLRVNYFIPGKTYYWKVTDETTGEYSKVDSFTVLDKPVRSVALEGAYNVRDIGGWKTDSGKTVKYGMVLRGAILNSQGNATALTATGKYVFESVLGIQTEIDLRKQDADDRNQTQNCVNSELGYLKVEMPQYTYIIPEFKQGSPRPRIYAAQTPTVVKAIFECFADAKNYPVYFHCNAGADRTGTVAYLLGGLLGVSYEDLTRDYELTSFSVYGKKWRGSANDFHDGVMQDNDDNYVAWGKLHDYMMRYYGDDGEKTLSEAIENYLIKVCGLSQETLQSVKDLLLA